MGIFSDTNIDCFDNIDLVNILLKRITGQPKLEEEDRRIITHLNECLFQMNLKKEKDREKQPKNFKFNIKKTVKNKQNIKINQTAKGDNITQAGIIIIGEK